MKKKFPNDVHDKVTVSVISYCIYVIWLHLLSMASHALAFDLQTKRYYDRKEGDGCNRNNIRL